MRTFALLALVLAATPDDGSTQFDLPLHDVRESLFAAATGSDFWTPAPSAALRAMNGPSRAAAVKVLAELARTYFTSKDFAARFQDWRLLQTGPVPTKPKTYEQAKKEQEEMMKHMLAKLNEQVA